MIEIRWTETALNHLENIFDFYRFNATEKIAQKIISEIIDSTESLKTNPKIGQKEQLLIDFNQTFRYIISRHTKIIYRIENDIVFITHAFDTRQNPTKLM